MAPNTNPELYLDEAFPNLIFFFGGGEGGPHIMGYSMLGSILGSLILGKSHLMVRSP